MARASIASCVSTITTVLPHFESPCNSGLVLLAGGAAAMGFGEQGVHIQIADFATIDLVESDLQLTKKALIAQTRAFIIRHWHHIVFSIHRI